MLTKKLAGTILFLLLISGAVLSTSTSVKALFVDTGKTLTLDAVIVSTDSSSLTVDASGTNMTIDITGKTVFAGGISLDDLIAGDEVFITAKTSENSNPRAIVIRKVNSAGYGTGYGNNNTAIVTDAIVTGKTADTFTVGSKSTVTTFKVTAGTNFNKGDFSTLKIGDKVLVYGEQTATQFIAKQVVVKSGGKGDAKNKDEKDKGDTEDKDEHGKSEKGKDNTETGKNGSNKGGSHNNKNED